jgi:hypothetical protein
METSSKFIDIGVEMVFHTKKGPFTRCVRST